MTQRPRDLRLVAVPVEHRAYIAGVIRHRGVPAAARILGVGRTALLGVVARGECMPGTAALIREAIARREEAA